MLTEMLVKILLNYFGNKLLNLHTGQKCINLVLIDDNGFFCTKHPDPIFIFYNILPPYRKTCKSTIYSNNFQLVNRNVNPIILKNGDGKNSLFIIQGTIKFPHSRLSSHSKKNFPIHGSAAHGEIFLYYSC